MSETATQHCVQQESSSDISAVPGLLEFLQAGSLDGVWYLSLEQPTQQWMSSRSKEIFGYSDPEVANASPWWQESIFPEDLAMVLENLRKHGADGNFPFDQTVRYKHKDGSTVWVRCRGLVLRDAAGNPIRVLGTHTGVTALKQGDEHRRALSDISPELYFVANSKTAIISESSRELQDNLGEEGSPGHSLLQLCNAPSLPALQSALHALDATSKIQNVELSLKRPDGSSLPVMLSACSVPRTETGEAVVRGWFRDISQLRLFANLELLIGSFPYGIFLADEDGLIAATNPAANELFGYRHGELMGKPFTNLLPDLDLTANTAYSSAFPKDGLAIRADGTFIPIRVGVSVVRLAEGVFQVISIADLTASKAMKTALSESEFRFRQLAESLPQLVWTCTPEGRRDYLSQQWVGYTGLSEADAVSGGWIQQVHPDDRDAVTAAWRKTIQTATDFRLEYRLRGADGGYRWFEARAVPLRNSENQIIKWFGTSTDIHEARETRVALERERARLANLVSLAPAVFCSFAIGSDGASSFPYAGPDFTELLGVGPGDKEEDLASLVSRFYPEDGERLRLSIRTSAETLKPWRSEFRIRHRSSGERWLEAHFAPSRETNECIVWHGFLNDVTERKQAEADKQFLLQMGSQLQSASNAGAIAHIATEMVTQHFQIARCSLNSVDMRRREATMLHQYVASGAAALPGTHPLKAWGSDQLVDTLTAGITVAVNDTSTDLLTASAYETAFKGAGIESLIAVPLRRAGELTCIFCLFCLKPRRWSGREIALARSVAERLWPAYEAARAMAAERAINVTLAASEERLRVALQSAAIGIWENNPITEEHHWDSRSRAMFGFAPDQVIELDLIISCIHPDDQELVTRKVMEYRDPAGSGHFKAEYRIIGRDDGRLRNIFGQGQMFFEGYGTDRHPVRAIGTLQDVTALKEGEEALRRANADLEQFAYAAAHDMQEPLRNVGLAAQILGDQYRGRFDSEADDLLKTAVDGSRRMRSMVKDLLAYSRVFSCDEEAVPSADANAAISLVVKNLEIAIAERDAQISWDTLPSLLIRKVHLDQLLQNLIANALKYSGDKRPYIHVSAFRRHKEYLLSVKDNGIGIAPEFHERAFGVFKRLHGQDIPGTGIGLALCKRIVEHYGGRIWIESQVGQGTTVSFTVNAA